MYVTLEKYQVKFCVSGKWLTWLCHDCTDYQH